MKKILRVLLIVILLVVILVGIMIFKVGNGVNKDAEKLDATEVVGLENVNDGTYEGLAETDLVKVTVKVTVKNHEITDIELVRHENGLGADAEKMIPEMIQNNTSEVDVVSGATISSKCIRAAVRDALIKGSQN